MNTSTAQNTQPDEQLMLPIDPPLEEAPQPEPDELETLRSENAGLKQALRLRDARDRLSASLKAAGARSPELLFAAAQDSLQFADDGSVQNAEAIVAGLKEKFPEQFGPFRLPPIDAGAGTSGSQNVLSRRALARMKPADIARLDWEQVKNALQD